MFSADEKRQQQRISTRRFVLWALGVSALLHGVLWAVSRLIPIQEAPRQTAFEVTFSTPEIPNPTKAPHLAANPKPTIRPKTTRQRVTRQLSAPRRVRRLKLRPVQRKNPPKSERHPTQTQNLAALPKNAAPPTQNMLHKAPASGPIVPSGLQPLDKPRPSSASGELTTGNSAPRRFNSGNNNRPTAPRNSARPESEVANLPDGENLNGSRQARGPRRRGSETQLYLPGSDNPTGSSGNTNNLSQPRPNGLQGGISRPVSSDASSVTSSGPRASRRALGGAEQTYIQPGAPRPTNIKEEATDDTPDSKNAAPRRTRLTRRPSDDPTLFPTPMPRPEPKEHPKPPEPKEETERELSRPAKVRSAPKPPYPSDAKANNQEGTVVLRLQISEAGRVTDAEIVSSSGVSSLDEASLRGVRRWTYEPARRGKTPIASSLTARLRWRLTD